MNINKEKLKDLLSYHPPVSEERKQKHEIVNQASVAFVCTLAEVVTDPDQFTYLLQKIQEVRMLANQAITYEFEDISVRGIFEE